jgi:hypothetical protein
MQEIQEKFVIKVKQLPDQIDSSSYSNLYIFKFSEIINSNSNPYSNIKKLNLFSFILWRLLL